MDKGHARQLIVRVRKARHRYEFHRSRDTYHSFLCITHSVVMIGDLCTVSRYFSRYIRKLVKREYKSLVKWANTLSYKDCEFERFVVDITRCHNIYTVMGFII
jgi:hypothetical protein